MLLCIFIQELLKLLPLDLTQYFAIIARLLQSPEMSASVKFIDLVP